MASLLFLAAVILAPLKSWAAPFTEPVIGDYTKVPVFSAQSAPPNIHVILDNSGSMNFNAYGNVTTSGNYRSDLYVPLYSSEITIEDSIERTTDDAEEYIKSGQTYYDSYDLDLGRTGKDRSGRVLHNIVGLRFDQIDVAQGMTIVSARLELEAKSQAPTLADGSVPQLHLRITGVAADDIATFTAADDAISNLEDTFSKVYWIHDNGADPWNKGTIHSPPLLTNIVQEIVNRPNWQLNNAIGLKLIYQTYSTDAKRDAVSYEWTKVDPNASPPRLILTYRTESGTRYYGYFNSDWLYTYSSGAGGRFQLKYKKIELHDTTDLVCPGKWEVRYPASYTTPDPDELNWSTKCLSDADFVSEELWDGNWMNWSSTRRVDVARKVLMGGRGATTGGGTPHVQGENSYQGGRDWRVRFKSDAVGRHAVSPYHGQYDYHFTTQNGAGNPGRMIVSGTSYNLDIELSPIFDKETFTSDGKVGGVLQTFRDAAYWGLEFFQNDGNGTNQEGGDIRVTLKAHPTDAEFINAVGNEPARTWTPLAESFYTAVQYFKQEPPASGLGYPNSAVPINTASDPFLRNNKEVPCVKNFVLLITDGASTKDSRIPNTYKDTDGDGDQSCSNDGNCEYPSGGSDYLDDLALYAHTTDLRSATVGKNEIEDVQSIDLYTVYAAFGSSDPNAQSLLQDAAKNGGFDDQNGDNMPDPMDWTDTDGDGTCDPGENNAPEWDGDGDCVPDNYFEAQDGAYLKAQLIRAINDILSKSASGTAVSVLSTSNKGEGQLVQAFFKPTTTGDPGSSMETKWAGYLRGLWVDGYGNLREDSDGDLALDETDDKVIQFISVAGDTMVKKYDNPYVDSSGSYSVYDVRDIRPIWEAGEVLAWTEPTDRKIFTYTDSTNTSFFGGVEFDVNNMALLRPYLGVGNDTTWSYMGPTIDERAGNLINFVRGHDSGFSGATAMRSRTIMLGLERTWKLGDIVNSTPMTIQAPPEHYDVLYGDRDFDEYKNFHKVHRDNDVLKGRETMVYVGANDGMLHAFTSWKYDSQNSKFYQPGSADGEITVTGTSNEEIGGEVWAYIPRSLLPHLKWLADQRYIHTPYVDIQPKITDAQIFTPDSTHINGWGTILISGLHQGGKEIQVNEDFNGDGSPELKTFSASYFLLDITDPRNPAVLWDRSYADLGMTTSRPTIMKVNDEWFAIFGSGPQTYDGTSNHPGRVYIVDLKTGDPVKGGGGTTDYLFSTPENNAFMGDVTSTDKFLNFSVDAAYIGSTYDSGNNPDWKGTMFKVTVPWICSLSPCDFGAYGLPAVGDYIDDPLDSIHPWTFTKLYEADGPITAAPTTSTDPLNNTWVYFGTGRFIADADKSNQDRQYLVGVKDPFFNKLANTSHNSPAGCSKDITDIDYSSDCGRNNYADDYTGSYTTNLTLDKTRLFDGDSVKVFYPWNAVPSKAGDATCNAGNNPLKRIGDLNDDDSCLAFDRECIETVPGVSCTAAVKADVTQEGDIYGDGTCQCFNSTLPPEDWVVVGPIPSLCEDFTDGELGVINGSCTGIYWDCQGYDDASCDGIAVGTVGLGLGDGTCNCESSEAGGNLGLGLIDYPDIYYWPRPAGDCTSVQMNATGKVYNDPAKAPYDGYCKASFWTCSETVTSACDSVDFLKTDYANVENLSSLNCTCSYSEEPVAQALDTATGDAFGLTTFEDIVKEARLRDGWFRELLVPRERSLSKPVLIGGLSLYTTFVPEEEACAFGGFSFLNMLYYETGTAFSTSGSNWIIDENGILVPTDRISLGSGKASAPSVFVSYYNDEDPDKEGGGTAIKVFVQGSGGDDGGGGGGGGGELILQLEGETALNIKSGLISWRED